jgi:hypothetical protein
MVLRNISPTHHCAEWDAVERAWAWVTGVGEQPNNR